VEVAKYVDRNIPYEKIVEKIVEQKVQDNTRLDGLIVD
jgi:hypothetical protein